MIIDVNIILSMEQFPKIVEAFRLIARDNGGLHRYTLPADDAFEKIEYHVPSKFVEYLNEINEFLVELSGEEFMDFCIGDAEEMQEIETRSMISNQASELLLWYFDHLMDFKQGA